MSKLSNEPLFNMTDYRAYIEAWARAKGRGEYRRISLALNMHTTLVSQILNGKKSLTEEQATKLCDYMRLNPLETDFFLKLVQIERAGSEQLKNIFSRHLKQIRNQANEISNRVPESKELTEQDRAIFYSSWHYSMIRLLTMIKGKQTAEEISVYLGISISRVQEILSFLASRGLCRLTNGRYVRTEQNTHVEARSALAIRHHQNWRSKSLELHEKMSSDDLAFTAPISIAKKDIQKIKKILLETISEISTLVEGSPSEEIVYLGIDCIKI
ncbi:MAG: TIGR02147 family protein [Bacteriovorax sp.]|nr:TIGR02147 family protein [Bacteriovorax sp.]